MRLRPFLIVFTTLPLLGGPCDKIVRPDSAAESCTCESGTLTALSGCENFGGDQEQCSGWASCEEDNGFAVGSTHPSGTVLTCFGCSIQLDCL